MIRGSMSLAIAAALAAGCSAAPTSIASATSPNHSNLGAPTKAPTIQDMRHLIPASITPEQAKTLLLKVDPSKIYLPSHAQGQSQGQGQGMQQYGQQQQNNYQQGAQSTPQQPNVTPLQPRQGQGGAIGAAPAGGIGAGYPGMGLGSYGACGACGLGLGSYGYPGIGAYGWPGIAGLYPFSYGGTPWFAPYYLDAGLYYPFAFSSYWTGMYSWLGSPFWGLGFGPFSYAPFGYGPWGLGAYGAFGCGCF